MEPTIFDITVANPGAGNDFLYTVPAEVQKWRILSIYFKLITNSTTANRQVALVIQNALASYVMGMYFSAVQAASIGGRYNAQPGVALGSVLSSPTQRLSLPLPSPLYLQGGDTIQTQTDNLQGTDQFSLIYIRAEGL